MKKIIKKIVFSKLVARIFLKPFLKLHNFSYFISGMYSSIINNGIHPKHEIIKYEEWFLNNIEKEWVVLDVGCNTGLMPEVMSEKATLIYGIEILKELIDEAKEFRCKKNIEYICADATIYDYSNCKPIDCITMSNVLEHIERRVEFLKKLTKHVKWNGKKRFLIRVPMIDREWIAVYKKELGIEYRLDSTHFIEYTFEMFESELKEASIEVKKYHIKFGEIYATCEGK